MLVNLQPLDTQLRRLQEIPVAFFQGLETATVFEDIVFPTWTETAFGGTQLKAKFRVIYEKYKEIVDPSERQKIINAFTNNNQIETLCRNQGGINFIPLTELHANVRNEIDSTFLYLYNTAVNHHAFNTLVDDTIRKAIDRFILTCRMQICPICGLEGYMNLEGQERIALDHWLCKDIFPVSAVNFDNLFPLGDKCNSRPAKGDTNILIDTAGNRVIAFYPFINHHRVSTRFTYNNEPSINPLTEADWNLLMTPTDLTEQSLFDSWNSIFNIVERYKDYFRKYIFPLWETDYKDFIKESELGHADNILELKENFTIWKASFRLSSNFGAVLHRAFIDNMINNCSDAYLFSLCENFISQAAVELNAPV